MFGTNGLAKLENRLLRLLKSEAGSKAALISLEKQDKENVYEESQKEINNVLIEAEYQKAKALITMHQARSFC